METKSARVWLALLALAGVGCAHAQGYPAKTIRIVVPYPAGGPADTTARLLAPRMSEALGRNPAGNRPAPPQRSRKSPGRAVAAKLIDSGAHVVGMPPDEFAAFFRSEMAKWEKAVKVAGVTVDQ